MGGNGGEQACGARAFGRVQGLVTHDKSGAADGAWQQQFLRGTYLAPLEAGGGIYGDGRASGARSAGAWCRGRCAGCRAGRDVARCPRLVLPRRAGGYCRFRRSASKGCIARAGEVLLLAAEHDLRTAPPEVGYAWPRASPAASSHCSAGAGHLANVKCRSRSDAAPLHFLRHHFPTPAR